MKLSIRRPDDMHLHLRDGAILERVVHDSAAVFGRAIIMPNLSPPVTTGAAAAEYRQRILAALPRNSTFDPLMTLYLTDDTDPEDVARSIELGQIAAVKLYPAGATTNSQNGVTDVKRTRPVLKVLAETGTPLCVHGEVADFSFDIFDREMVFIRNVLEPIRNWEPDLRIVLEHVTTVEGVNFARENYPATAATITVHHLVINRNHIFQGGIRPHFYCLPVAKREHHRQALVEAATSGGPEFFLGTDSAPHLAGSKECAVGCAGIYTAPVALPWLAQIFEDAASLSSLESFTSINGARFYRLPPNEDKLVLRKRQEPLEFKREVTVEDDVIVVFDPGPGPKWEVAGKSGDQDD